MSNDFYTILTNAGLAAIANASVSNSTVNFAKVAVGDGNGAYYTPTRDMTALRNQTWKGTVTSVQVDENNPNWINVETVIPATDGGFYIREIGIFNDANVLLAIGKLPETYKPEMESGSTKDLYLKAIFEVTNASVISMKADPSVVLASKKYVDDKVVVISGNLISLQQQVTQHLADYSQFKTQVDEAISEISDPSTGVEAKFNDHLDDYVKHPTNGGTTAGTATAYTCNSSPNPATLVDKMGLVITIHVDSGSNPTLKWGSLVAKPIKKPNGSAANLKKDGLYSLRYNSINDSFILQGESEVEIGQQIITPKTTNQAILTGVHDGTGYVVGSPNLLPSNIKNGVNIFGVIGSVQEGAKITQVPISMGMSKLISGSYGTWQGTDYHTGIVVPEGVKQIIFKGYMFSDTFSEGSSDARTSVRLNIGSTLIWACGSDRSKQGRVHLSMLLQKDANTVENISYKANYGDPLGESVSNITGNVSSLYGGKLVSLRIEAFSNTYSTGTGSIGGTLIFVV